MIELKPLSKEDVIPFYSWLNDDDVIKYSMSLFQRLNSPEQIEHWFSSLFEEKNTYNIGIYLKNTQQLIGYAGISGISTLNKSGEYFIFIGDKNQWGKGIGTIVTQKVIAYGFEVLNLNRIMLTVSQPNIGGVKAYERAGFKIEGVLREACYREAAFHDKIVMSILQSEYEK
ncbi:GNAT family N-acetyltransferase [Myroides sp. 1354]|uniref:GNAT family N-acetyltransferase n=1 Tax=unclassified Myroides TaxID=2642485 RepID=UPI0025749591|nr:MULTISPECIES: GNAT family protein [unclassified Myroides]MDM1045759.1 GNAT family N-acetyltransferase [Myroides sp. R163-1]MDM1056761.1 GNAT family N-acetyltransferase [Myroides sp. 1354]MDM1070554.1 GNAT family N-acetyltransferase [Myroides sp. 1372]